MPTNPIHNTPQLDQMWQQMLSELQAYIKDEVEKQVAEKLKDLKTSVPTVTEITEEPPLNMDAVSSKEESYDLNQADTTVRTYEPRRILNRVLQKKHWNSSKGLSLAKMV